MGDATTGDTPNSLSKRACDVKIKHTVHGALTLH